MHAFPRERTLTFGCFDTTWYRGLTYRELLRLPPVRSRLQTSHISARGALPLADSSKRSAEWEIQKIYSSDYPESATSNTRFYDLLPCTELILLCALSFLCVVPLGATRGIADRRYGWLCPDSASPARSRSGCDHTERAGIFCRWKCACQLVLHCSLIQLVSDPGKSS